ncbi:hypothetical protein SPHINGO8AM_170040 [Sphingomonas sp. 8AM]|nr:hypothetical protein SPHINGO8AM_170040 [Sphingomonas sp. 8AM]
MPDHDALNRFATLAMTDRFPFTLSLSKHLRAGHALRQAQDERRAGEAIPSRSILL